MACLPALHPVLILRNQANQVINRPSSGTRRAFRGTGLIDYERGMAVVAVESPKERSETPDFATGSKTSDPTVIKVERNTTVEVEYELTNSYRTEG